MIKRAIEMQNLNLQRQELTMKVVGEFVKKHEFWEYSKGGKNYIAEITGLSKRYGFQRRFLKMRYRGQEKHYLLKDFVPGHLYEVVSIYYITKKNPYPRIKSIFECTSIREDEVYLREVFESEVIKRFTDHDTVTISEILVKQLLRNVSADEAIALIGKVSDLPTE